MKGVFQFNPGSATRKNLPKRVITATSAVVTVKNLPNTVESTIIAAKPSNTMEITFIRASRYDYYSEALCQIASCAWAQMTAGLAS